MRKNSLDLNNVNPECIEIRNNINRTQKNIDGLKSIYEGYTNKLMLSHKDMLDKSEIGRQLFQLNVKAIHLIHDLAMCQEGRSVEII